MRSRLALPKTVKSAAASSAFWTCGFSSMNSP
jgi:hypothetical protein